MSDLKVPEFKSAVPEVLRHPMTEQDRSIWVADQLSIQSQQLSWVCERLVETNRVACETAQTVASWREKIVSPAAILIAIAAWVTPVVVAILFR